MAIRSITITNKDLVFERSPFDGEVYARWYNHGDYQNIVWGGDYDAGPVTIIAGNRVPFISMTRTLDSSPARFYATNSVDPEKYGEQQIGPLHADGPVRIDFGAGDWAKSGRKEAVYVSHGVEQAYDAEGEAWVFMDPAEDTLIMAGDSVDVYRIGWNGIRNTANPNDGNMRQGWVESFWLETDEGHDVRALVGFEREGPRERILLTYMGGEDGAENADRAAELLMQRVIQQPDGWFDLA